MKKTQLFILLILSAFACQSHVQQTSTLKTQIITTHQDSLILEDFLSRYSSKKEMTTANLILEIGKEFMGTPYVSSTLENGKEEKLVMNLLEQDCTTFAEYCLAISLTIKSGQPSFEVFKNKLEQIRYRNGERDGYPSRLHYFSDWIFNNEQKGLVTQPANFLGSSFNNHVNFMSAHPDSYSMLKENPEMIKVIAEQETEISSRTSFYLKKEDVEANEARLHDGDIVGITTSIEGLDVAHVGILIKVNGRIHLLNASSAQEKVIISEETLADLLINKKSYTGIMIARPK